MDARDLPWPSGTTSPDAELDYTRLPYEIKRALAGIGNPSERLRLLALVGDAPTLATTARVHPEGGVLGVVVDGCEVAQILVARLAGIDHRRVLRVLFETLDRLPGRVGAHLADEIEAGRVTVRISCPPDDDWVSVLVGEQPLVTVHRKQLVDGFDSDA